MYSLQTKKYFDFQLTQSDIRPPAENEVVVRVLACGVCGTDVHLMKRAETYTPLGHEIAAEIVETGANVTAYRPGDTVIVEDVTFCGLCRDCKNGDTHLCKNNYDLGGQSGMGEYLTVDRRLLVPYSGLDPAAACLTEPLAVSINTYLAAKIPLNGTLVVFGMGALGLMCVRLAKHFGASRVVCVGSHKGSVRNQAREQAAYKLGADKVLYADDRLEEAVTAAFNGTKADGVIVTSPPKTLPAAMCTAKFGANIVVIGVDLSGHAKADIDIDALIFNKNTIVPVFAEPAKMFPLSNDLIKTGVIDPKLLITHTFWLDETEKLRDLFTQDRPVIKAVMTKSFSYQN